MTDLFISAAAALLMVLAVLNPTPPTPLPVQAKVAVLCPDAQTDTAIFTLFAADDQKAVRYPVSDQAELSRAIAEINVQDNLIVALGVLPDENGRIAAGCLNQFTKTLVLPHNESLPHEPTDEQAGTSAVLTVSLVEGIAAPTPERVP